MEKAPFDPDKFDWVQLKADLDGPHKQHNETFTQKLGRKFDENPLVPIGCLATTAALTYGLISFRRGDPKTAQLMMRIRVGAQGFTVVGLLAGIYMAAVKQPNKT